MSEIERGCKAESFLFSFKEKGFFLSAFYLEGAYKDVWRLERGPTIFTISLLTNWMVTHSTPLEGLI